MTGNFENLVQETETPDEWTDQAFSPKNPDWVDPKGVECGQIEEEYYRIMLREYGSYNYLKAKPGSFHWDSNYIVSKNEIKEATMFYIDKCSNKPG